MKFEDYLAEQHADQYIGCDDDMPDSFNDWMADLDTEELIEYADKFTILMVEWELKQKIQ